MRPALRKALIDKATANNTGNVINTGGEAKPVSVTHTLSLQEWQHMVEQYVNKCLLDQADKHDQAVKRAAQRKLNSFAGGDAATQVDTSGGISEEGSSRGGMDLVHALLSIEGIDDEVPGGGDLEQSIKDAVALGPSSLSRNRSSSTECTTTDGASDEIPLDHAGNNIKKDAQDAVYMALGRGIVRAAVDTKPGS